MRRPPSSDDTCVTSRTRQVRSLRAAPSEYSSTARSLPSEGRDGGSNPPTQTNTDVAQMAEAAASEAASEGSTPSIGTA